MPQTDVERRSQAVCNYPALARRVFVVRTPAVFNAVWGILRPLVPDPDNSIRVAASGDTEGALAALREHFDDARRPISNQC